MSEKTNVPARIESDPFAILRQMTAEFDRAFDAWPAFRWPAFWQSASARAAAWTPRLEVFEKDNRLVTRVDLPGMKKEDVSVEVTDGQLTLSGERKHESEEKNKDYYRSEREYGRFYRRVPLPEGVKLEDVKATFADGVLEVSLPVPAKVQAPTRRVQIEEPKAAAKSAGA